MNKKRKIDRLELDQAMLRTVMVLLVITYLALRSHLSQEILIICGINQLVNIILIGWLFFSRNVSVTRRVIGIILEVATVTWLIANLDHVGALLATLYLWKIFGTGFRYGFWYLIAAQALSLVGMLYIVRVNEYWLSNQTLGDVMLVMLSVLPVYVAILIKQSKQAQDKSTAANMAKTRFLASISHEIRTPLNGIIGILPLLKVTKLDSEQRYFINNLDSSSKLLLSLLNNVLDISKIEEGQINIERKDMNIKQIVEETAATFHLSADLKSVKINTHCSQHYNVVGDPYILRQILANLFGNAVKFTEKGSIEFHAIVLHESEDDVTIRFEIEDTGIGIPLEKQPYIFDSFMQVHSDKSSKFGGTGLGLTICRQLVNALGSELSFDSVVGEGTKFWFDLTFPKSTHSTLTVFNTIPDVSNGVEITPLEILICEDDYISHMVLSKMLKIVGHKPTVVQNGTELLEILAKHTYDIVISDLNIDHINGIDALIEYRKLNPEDTYTRFILLTADATLDAKVRSNDAGYDVYLTKPIDSYQLFSSIGKLTNQPLAYTLKCMEILSGQKELPRHESPNMQILDMSKLNELSMLGKTPDFVPNILNAYLSECRVHIRYLEENIATLDNARLKSICHKIKGSSANIGAKLVVKSTNDISAASHEQIQKGGSWMIKKLKSDFHKTETLLQSYLQAIRNKAHDNDGYVGAIAD